MDAYADALEGLGWSRKASEVRSCGRQVFVSACGACGEANACVRASISCDARGCPLCARRHAADRARTLTGAALRVADMVRAREDAIRAELDAQVVEHKAMRDRWAASARAARQRATRARSEGTRRRHEADAARSDAWELASEGRRRKAAYDRKRVGEVRSWRWSLVTISPPWNPEDAEALTIEGLQRRAVDVWERWERVWSRLSAGGLAAATAHVELSDHGHVHLHALVFGPFVLNATLRKAAGCIVDRPALKINGETFAEALESLVREAAKYAVKGPSATGWDWITGASHSKRSTHPVTAARWTVAIHGAQTIRHFGSMRSAVSAEIAAQPEGEVVDDMQRQTAPRCPCCGADALLPPMIRRTVDVARELGPDGWRWHGRESPPGAKVAGAGERLPPRVGFFYRLG